MYLRTLILLNLRIFKIRIQLDIQNEKNKFNLENYKISAGLHKQKNVIWIRFDYNPQLIKKLKSYFKNIKWSATQKAWYLPDNTHYRKLCDLEEKIVGKEVLSKIHEINLPEFQKFIDKLT